MRFSVGDKVIVMSDGLASARVFEGDVLEVLEVEINDHLEIEIRTTAPRMILNGQRCSWNFRGSALNYLRILYDDNYSPMEDE